MTRGIERERENKTWTDNQCNVKKNLPGPEVMQLVYIVFYRVMKEINRN